MKTLIKRDIRVIGFLINAVLVLVGIVYSPTKIIVEDRYVTLWIGIVLVSFMVGIIHMMLGKGDNNAKMDIVLNSLPINKSIIVGSRYMTIMIYILASSFIIFLSSHFWMYGTIIIRRNNSLGLWEGLWIAGINVLLYSLYLPIDYYFNGRFDEKSEMVVVLDIFLILLARISMKQKNFIYKAISNMDSHKLPLGLIGLSIIAYAISLWISIKIYKFKEF